MTQEHPITPPPELMEQWLGMWPQESLLAAAQWGADQELDACCEWHRREYSDGLTADLIRSERRPKPPSLKEQALEAVKQIPVEPDGGPWRTAMETIILALHQLPDND